MDSPSPPSSLSHPISASSPAVPPSDADHPCSICRDVPSASDRATVPSCGHTFCAGCIVTAACVRPICALCRAPFSALLVRRALNGDILPAPTAESVALLRRAQWVDARAIAPGPLWAPPPADAALAAAMADERLSATGATAARAERGAATVPYFVDERVEDAFEQMVWEQEEKRYEREERRWDVDWRPRGGGGGGGSSSRTVGNRPFGQNGYVASGRRMARPTRQTRAPRAEEGRTDCATVTGERAVQQQPARRKKKVKKKSRAGIAAAKAAAAAEAAAASENGAAGRDEAVVEVEEAS